MSDFAFQSLTLFAGVFSVVAGVVLMAMTIGILVVPYLLMMEEARDSDRLSSRDLMNSRNRIDSMPSYR